MPESKKLLSWRFLILLGIAALLVVIFLRTPKPCQEPITYRLGRIDERFGLSPSAFSLAVRKAADIWGKPLTRDLFREDPKGTIEISLIYDYRQETADKLRQINDRMDGTKDTYEGMKSRLENLKSDYEQNRATLENDFHAYNARVNSYNAEIESWNRQGGAPEEHRTRLTSAKNDLDSLLNRLKTRQEEAKGLTDEINRVVLATNEIAARQNRDVDHYRDVGSRLDGEFQEGFFQSKEGRQSITIYHFDNEAKLVRLLAHELGHALRLNHSNDPNAVMYRLNQSDAAELTTDDIVALKARCDGK